jgi:hypothetical protein
MSDDIFSTLTNQATSYTTSNTSSTTNSSSTNSVSSYLQSIQSTSSTSATDTNSLVMSDYLRSGSNLLYQEVSTLNEGIGVISIIDNTLNNQQDYLEALKERVDEYKKAEEDRKEEEEYQQELRDQAKKANEEYYEKYRQKQDYEIMQLLQSYNSEATNAIYRGLSLLTDDSALSEVQTNELQSNQTTADQTGYVTLYSSQDVTEAGSSTLEFSNEDELFRLDTVEYGEDLFGIRDLADQINGSEELFDLEAEWEVELFSTDPLEDGYLEELFINGTQIDPFAIDSSDDYSAMLSAINSQTSSTGVSASTFTKDSGSFLLLESDGRGIVLGGNSDNLNLNGDETYGKLGLKSKNRYMIDFEDLDETLEDDIYFSFNLADIVTELTREEDTESFSKAELADFALDSIESAQEHLQEYSDIINSDKRAFVEDVSNFIEVLNNERASEYGIVYNPEDYEKFDPNRLNSEDISFSFTKDIDSLHDISMKVLLDVDENMVPQDNQVDSTNNQTGINQIQNPQDADKNNPNFGVVNSDYFNEQSNEITSPTAYQSPNQDVEKL